MAAAIANRAFGIELEVNFPLIGSTLSRVASAIRAVGVECREEGYSHDVPRAWKVVRDASVSDGCEVVSPKLIGERGVAQAVTVAKVLQNMGCRVSKSTGFHLHVDAADLSAPQLANTGICFLWFETFFDHIMPESRRGSHNTFITSNRSKFGGYGAEALNAGIAAIKAVEGQSKFRVTNAINPGCRCQHEGFASRCNCVARYSKMNARAVNHHGTIEFRQHSGTIEHEKVENWIRLMVQFVEKAKTSKPRPRTVVRDWTASQEMHLFFSMFNIDRDIAKYYVERRATIAKQDKARAVTEAAEAAERTRLTNASQAEREAAREAERLEQEARASQGRELLASFAPLAIDALHARLEANQRNYRAASRVRRYIEILTNALRNGDSVYFIRACSEATRRRLLPVAILRMAPAI